MYTVKKGIERAHLSDGLADLVEMRTTKQFDGGIFVFRDELLQFRSQILQAGLRHDVIQLEESEMSESGSVDFISDRRASSGSVSAFFFREKPAKFFSMSFLFV